MENRHFNSKDLLLLARPQRWRLATCARDANLDPADSADTGHLAWSQKNQHVHGFPEFLLVLRGCIPWGFDGRLFSAKPGAAFFVGGGTPHEAYYPPETSDFAHLWIRMPRSGIFFSVHRPEQGCQANAQNSRGFIPPDRLPMDFSTWLDALPHEGRWRRERVRVCLQMVVLLAVEAGYRQPAPSDRVDDLHGEVIRAVGQHLRETGGINASLDAMAALVGYSKFHLHRLFKQKTGMTIRRYADRCRLRRALDLESQGWSATRIAKETGFASSATFCRWKSKQQDVDLGGIPPL